MHWNARQLFRDVHSRLHAFTAVTARHDLSRFRCLPANMSCYTVHTSQALVSAGTTLATGGVCASSGTRCGAANAFSNLSTRLGRPHWVGHAVDCSTDAEAFARIAHLVGSYSAAELYLTDASAMDASGYRIAAASTNATMAASALDRRRNRHGTAVN